MHVAKGRTYRMSWITTNKRDWFYNTVNEHIEQNAQTAISPAAAINCKIMDRWRAWYRQPVCICMTVASKHSDSIFSVVSVLNHTITHRNGYSKFNERIRCAYTIKLRNCDYFPNAIKNGNFYLALLTMTSASGYDEFCKCELWHSVN